VTIIATHIVLYRAHTAAEELAAEGVECEIIDPRSLVPLDEETIFESARKTGRVVIAHEDNLRLGWGAEVASRIAQECFYSLEAPIQRVATYDVPIPFAPELEQSVVPSAERIKEAVRAALVD
jgi:pyruvate dehydrogenase E1 component beta subunit